MSMIKKNVDILRLSQIYDSFLVHLYVVLVLIPIHITRIRGLFTHGSISFVRMKNLKRRTKRSYLLLKVLNNL